MSLSKKFIVTIYITNVKGNAKDFLKDVSQKCTVMEVVSSTSILFFGLFYEKILKNKF